MGSILTKPNNFALVVISSAIAGLVGALNFAPYNLWWLSIFAIALLFWNLNKSTWLTGLLCIWAFWATHFTFGMFWVQKGMAVYSRVSDEKAVVITLFLGLCYSLFLSLPWILYSRTRPNSFSRLILFPFIWILGEWGRYWIFDGLTWFIQGYGHQSSWLAGWIPVFGALSASFFCAVTAALLVFLVQIKTRASFVSCSIAIALIWIGGGLLSKIDWTSEMGISVPVTAVQPNRPLRIPGTSIEERRKLWMAEIESMSLEYWRPGLVIWPEGAIKLKPQSVHSYLNQINASSKLTETAFFTGGPFYPDPENDQYSFNSIYGLGQATGKYHKVRRAPLGEYAPLNGHLGKIVPWLNSAVPPKSFGSKDQPPLKFEFKKQQFTVGTSICYELAFGNHVRRTAEDANLLLNVSNDAWFDGTRELDQALQIAQIRALEHQKPLVRSTNSGLTAVIDHRGNIVKVAPRETTTVFESEIRPRNGQTPYSLWGDIPVFVIALLSILVTHFFRKQR